MITLKPANSGGYRAYWENGALLGEVFQLEDGYYVWLPNNNGGVWTEYILRQMADNLRDLNAEWHKKICQVMTGPSTEGVGRDYVPPTDLSQEPF